MILQQVDCHLKVPLPVAQIATQSQINFIHNDIYSAYTYKNIKYLKTKAG